MIKTVIYLAVLFCTTSAERSDSVPEASQSQRVTTSTSSQSSVSSQHSISEAELPDLYRRQINISPPKIGQKSDHHAEEGNKPEGQFIPPVLEIHRINVPVDELQLSQRSTDELPSSVATKSISGKEDTDGRTFTYSHKAQNHNPVLAEEKSDGTSYSKRGELQHIPVLKEQRITTRLTIEPPQQQHRTIQQRFIRPRVASQRSTPERIKERQNHHVEQQSPLANLQKTDSRDIHPGHQEGTNPLDFHHFQQQDVQESHHQQHVANQPQQQQQQVYRQIHQRPDTSSHGPVFDLGRLSTSSQSKPETTLPNLVPFPQSQDTVPKTRNGSGSPRLQKPIIFNLGNRGRSHQQRRFRSKNARNHRIHFQDDARSRPTVRYIRPKQREHQENPDINKSSQPISLHKTDTSSSEDEDNDEWIPTSGPGQASTLKFSSQAPSATPTIPSFTNEPPSKTIGNVTLSLQQARQLFARAQERYKALAAKSPNLTHEITASNITPAATEPKRQYSFSYSKIRHSDGTVSDIKFPPPNTSLHFSTTPVPTFVETPTTIDYQSTTQYQPTTEYQTSTLITTPKPPSTKPFNGAADAVQIQPKQDLDVTKAEPTVPSPLNDSTVPKPTSPFPVYKKDSPYALPQLPSSQNFNLFGFSNSDQKQAPASFLQSAASASPSHSNQPSSLSNLFGLGSLPSLGGLSSSLGSLGNFGLGQGFGTLNTGTSQIGQQSSSGVGNLGYLSLLSGLTGLNLGQPSSISSPELSLPTLGQEGKTQQPSPGLGILSGLPSLGLGGLGSLGSLGSLGNLGSIPSIGGLSGSSGSSRTGLDGLTGLGSLGLSSSGGLSGLGIGSPGGIANLRVHGSGLIGQNPGTSSIDAQSVPVIGDNPIASSSGITAAAVLSAAKPSPDIIADNTKVSHSLGDTGSETITK